LEAVLLPMASAGRQYSCAGEIMKSWIYLLIAIVFEIIGTSGLKASDGFSRLWPSLLTIMTYATAFFFFSITLRTIPVGIAYAVWGGVGIVLM
jgi:small multidrug resistance pump